MDKIKNKIKMLEERMSDNRVIQEKSGDWICKFCKENPDDCFCKENSELELKGINFVLKNLGASKINKKKVKK